MVTDTYDLGHMLNIINKIGSHNIKMKSYGGVCIHCNTQVNPSWLCAQIQRSQHFIKI